MSARVGVLGKAYWANVCLAWSRSGHRSGRSLKPISQHPVVPLLVRIGWAGGKTMRSATLPQRFIAIFLFVLVTAGTALAQSDRGTIAGTILDSSGAVVQGAIVTATGANTGAIYKTTTTD